VTTGFKGHSKTCDPMKGPFNLSNPDSNPGLEAHDPTKGPFNLYDLASTQKKNKKIIK